MKNLLITILIIVLVVLFGTWPLSIISKIFDILATAIQWLAEALNIFGWNGLI